MESPRFRAGVVLADVIHELQGHTGHCPLSLQVQIRLKFSETRRASGEAGNSPCTGVAGEGAQEGLKPHPNR